MTNQLKCFFYWNDIREDLNNFGIPPRLASLKSFNSSRWSSDSPDSSGSPLSLAPAKRAPHLSLGRRGVVTL
ncbi:hypothetical protein SAMN06265218_10645 [Fodinibius sediminis]|uniref:Uncharacterized protein n=1 Tax=Fodinibius sediminis TaxID=1214077 RepID=A0A521CGD0_9BACT|nr:hypothetical protein SAMN06265218_10645 [Fodinibius sediminis]